MNSATTFVSKKGTLQQVNKVSVSTCAAFRYLDMPPNNEVTKFLLALDGCLPELYHQPTSNWGENSLTAK